MPRGSVIDVAWLREHYPRMTDIESLLDDYEAKFGNRPTKAAVYMKASKLGIRKAPVIGRKDKAERAVYWSKEPAMEAWMLENDHGQRMDELQAAWRERFGFNISHGQVNRFRAAHGTQTRKSHGGGRPLLPIGTERIGKDGYVVVKVREKTTVPMSKDNWMLKHVWAYEQAYGPVPEGHVVYFADGDRRNFDPENLVAVPRRLVGVMNNLRADGTTWHDRDTLLAVVALAELSVTRNKAVASIVRTCPCCGKKFDNQVRRKAGNVAAIVCPECGAKGRRPPYVNVGRRRVYDHDEIRRMHEAGMLRAEIAERVGCSKSTVSDVLHDRAGQRREKRRCAEGT